jgi:restriction system protein
LIFFDSAHEMQRKAANTRRAHRNSLRTGKFSRFNRECRSAEKQAHRGIYSDCEHRRGSSLAAQRARDPACMFFVCSRPGSLSLPGASSPKLPLPTAAEIGSFGWKAEIADRDNADRSAPIPAVRIAASEPRSSTLSSHRAERTPRPICAGSGRLPGLEIVRARLTSYRSEVHECSTVHKKSLRRREASLFREPPRLQQLVRSEHRSELVFWAPPRLQPLVPIGTSVGVGLSGASAFAAAGEIGTRIEHVTRTADLLLQAVIVPGVRTNEGRLIEAVTVPWFDIIALLDKDPSIAFQLTPEKWEEMIAGIYKQSGFDEVTLTPRSNDRGRDVIAIIKGVGSVRVIDSVKAYKPPHLVEYDDVRALIGVLHGDGASKGFLTTTSNFAPNMMKDPLIARWIPTQLELVNGEMLFARLQELAKNRKT